jgi:hypothetical protein
MTALKPLSGQELRVYDSLQLHADAIDQVASGEWQLLLHRNGDLLVTARALGEAWLALSAPLPSLHVASLPCDELWTLLEWNGTLPGGVRFAVLPGARIVHLQAEIPTDHEAILSARVVEACAGFHAAWAKVHGNKEEQAETLNTCFAPTPDKTCDLPSLCREAEWPFIERSDGRVTVALDVPHETFSATLTRRRDESVRLSVELVQAETLPYPCRQALGLMLLTAGGVVRMARPVFEQSADGPVVRFEVKFASPPTATEFAHALSALSVAVRLCGREIQVLRQDEKIAKEYLTLGQMRHNTQTTHIAEKN